MNDRAIKDMLRENQSPRNPPNSAGRKQGRDIDDVMTKLQSECPTMKFELARTAETYEERERWCRAIWDEHRILVDMTAYRKPRGEAKV